MWLYPYTMIITQIYFFITGVITLRYALKSRNNPEKKNKPEYFKNEVIVAAMFFVLFIIYPWIFNVHIKNELVRHQCYFHVWDSLTVQYIIWPIYISRARHNDKKKNRHYTYEEWKKLFLEKYEKKNKVKADAKRKLMHLIPPALVIGMYYLGYALNGITMAGVEWDYESMAVFWSISTGFTFEYIMIIADLLRLNKFDYLGEFARNWAEGMIRPSELDTFTSSNLMILAFIPFFFAPFRIIFAVVVIAAISDAMAALIGKKFGKHHFKNDEKTIEGYAAGVITTYFIVLAMNALLNLTEPALPVLLVHLMAVGASIGFFIVDRYAREISDNFLNPIVTGIIMMIIYFIYV